MLFNTHIHMQLNKKFTYHEMIKNASDKNIKHMCNIFLSYQDYKKNRKSLEEFESLVFGLGIHPHKAKDATQQDLYMIDQTIKNDKKIKAYGELGLDDHRHISPKEKQIQIFKEQLSIAKSNDLSLILHARDTEEEATKILEENGFSDTHVQFHCYNGNVDLAKYIIQNHPKWYISFSGTCTKKEFKTVRQIASICPLKNILIETDDPYLTPIQVKEKNNEPANLIYVAKEIALLKNCNMKIIEDNTYNNAMCFFKMFN